MLVSFAGEASVPWVLPESLSQKQSALNEKIRRLIKLIIG